ncbi:DUF6349 family protein [Actinomadura napierensis]|uniref:DUF6349 family protein n=1 Tax=Actinomadura napierensis TaxID=267854 RepID=UPI00387E9B5D
MRRIYLGGWFERGRPVVTLRRPGLMRHVPQGAPGGGYDMARPRRPAVPYRTCCVPPNLTQLSWEASG